MKLFLISPQPSLFLALSYLLRFLEGLGGAGVWATMLAILLARSSPKPLDAFKPPLLPSYPSRPAAVYAFYDATFGLGFSLGPVLGAFLYDLSGFLLPFLVCGSALLLMGLLSFPVVLPVTKEAESQISSSLPSPWPLFSSPAFLNSLLVTIGAAVTFGFTESLLELHLENFHLSVTSVGLYFLGYAIAYTLATLLVGTLIDVYICPWTVNSFGLLCSAIAFYLLCPKPYNPLPSSPTVTLIFLVIQVFTKPLHHG